MGRGRSHNQWIFREPVKRRVVRSRTDARMGVTYLIYDDMLSLSQDDQQVPGRSFCTLSPTTHRDLIECRTSTLFFVIGACL
jgi:hypothetical protein